MRIATARYTRVLRASTTCTATFFKPKTHRNSTGAAAGFSFFNNHAGRVGTLHAAAVAHKTAAGRHRISRVCFLLCSNWARGAARAPLALYHSSAAHTHPIVHGALHHGTPEVVAHSAVRSTAVSRGVRATQRGHPSPIPTPTPSHCSRPHDPRSLIRRGRGGPLLRRLLVHHHWCGHLCRAGVRCVLHEVCE